MSQRETKETDIEKGNETPMAKNQKPKINTDFKQNELQDMSVHKDVSIDIAQSPMRPDYMGINRTSSFSMDESLYSVSGGKMGDYGPGMDGQGMHMQLNDNSMSIDE